MQFQVPQFIETEDKIVGPFSLRQFIYVGGAIGVSAIFYFFVQTWLFFIIAIILIGGSAAAAFMKVEGRPLADVVKSALLFYWKPQTYVWRSDHPIAARHRPQSESQGEQILERILMESPLHKSWEGLQSGMDTKKLSDREAERRPSEEYQIFRANAGDRRAGRRVDYR